MAYFSQNVQTTNDYFIHEYAGADMETLTKVINETMTTTGYKQIEGVADNAVYEKGNKVLRLLFGAFVKYFKFAIQVKPSEDGKLQLRVTKHASGVAGGIIGISQVKKELKRLNELMKDI